MPGIYWVIGALALLVLIVLVAFFAIKFVWETCCGSETPESDDSDYQSAPFYEINVGLSN